MSLQFRACKPGDVNDVIPLMYSAGPETFRYVFSVNYNDQVIDFLRYAFCKGDGEFGFKDHQVAIDDGRIVALVGRREAKDNRAYTFAAIKQILAFFGIFNGLKVIIRGLRFEAIVAPPVKNVICLHNLAVAEGLRGKGYGRQVIQHFVEKEKHQGKTCIGLNVAITNPHAKVLYQKLGFVVKGRKSGKLENRYGRGVDHEYMEMML